MKRCAVCNVVIPQGYEPCCSECSDSYHLQTGLQIAICAILLTIIGCVYLFKKM